MSYLFTVKKVPVSFVEVFSSPKVIKIDEDYSYRPDLVMSDYYNESIADDFTTLEYNNTSPLSLNVGDEYKIYSLKAMEAFRII